MPSGRPLDVQRLRSLGPLDTEELAFCQAQGIALAFDPLQLGWVTAECTDDLSAEALALPAAEPSQSPGANARPPFVAPEGRRRVDPRASTVELELRPWSEPDVELYRALLSNPRVWEFLPEPYPGPLTREQALDLIEISNSAEHHEVRAVLFHGELVGQIRLAFSGPFHGDDDAEISYWLGEAHWGRGIMSKLLELYTQKSFAAHARLTSIFARVEKDNVGSRKALERAGYAAAPREGSPGYPEILTYRRRRAEGTLP